jgi:molybdopterin synthase sulfur carrier subunit
MNIPATSESMAGPGCESTDGGAPVTLLLFAAAREAAGRSRMSLTAATVSQALEQARALFGTAFSEVMDRSRVWLNGEPAEGPEALHAGDEVAVLPPVSGG